MSSKYDQPSEASVLDDQHQDQRGQEDAFRLNYGGMLEAYAEAKNANTGESIRCPACGNRMTKRTYQHAFCGRRCKDYYWNRADEKRQSRACWITKGLV